MVKVITNVSEEFTASTIREDKKFETSLP